MRGLVGKPIYGDWKAGTVTLLYPPLFLGVLGLARAIGLDPIVFCRSANLGFFLLSLGLVAVVASGHAEGRRRVSVPGLLGGIFMLSAWKQYFWMAPIHPAALLLAISVVTCAILAFRPAATVPLALCGSIAVLAKQSGIGLLVAVLVHVAITDRKRLLRFCVVAGVALGLAVAMFELQSQGQFLRSVFFYPGRIFTGQFGCCLWLRLALCPRGAPGFFPWRWCSGWTRLPSYTSRAVWLDRRRTFGSTSRWHASWLLRAGDGCWRAQARSFDHSQERACCPCSASCWHSAAWRWTDETC
jgi:hypothetical protein